MNNEQSQYSGSDRQPVATSPTYTFTEYVGQKGKTLAAETTFREMAEFYRHAGVPYDYEVTWNSFGAGKYFNTTIRNADEAMEAMRTYEFPSEIKSTARRASRKLVDTFQQVAKIHTERHLMSGRLDRRKLTRIGRELESGTYRADVVRPHRRTSMRPGKLPTLAIVADAANTKMWSDAQYIPKLMEVALSVVWACEAAGIQTYAALTQGQLRYRKGGPCNHMIGAYLFATPEKIQSTAVLGIALHRDLWRYGAMTAVLAHEGVYERFMNVSHTPGKRSKSEHPWISCSSGGRAVEWARNALDADVVVSIGNIDDRKDADLQLDLQEQGRYSRSYRDVDDIIEDIAGQAKKLNRK